jgi:acyl carrier protein
MEVEREVLHVLDEVLSLNGRGLNFGRNTHLLGAVPELDSMAVVALVTSLEERFAIAIDDDDIDGQTFASVGSLSDFVRDKLSAAA